MLTDVSVISQRLGPLAEAGKNIAKLQTLVKDKSIPRKNVSQAMAGLLKRSSSKKEVEQEETAGDATVEKDDGDEDGESLGILTKEQATDQEAQAADDAEREAALATPAVEAISTPTETSEPTTEVSVPTADSAREPTEPTETSPSGVPAPTTPAKDNVAETEKLEPAGEDDATVTETLAASPVQEKELPVDPVSPMDAENAPLVTEENATEDAPPALPVKDANADGTDNVDKKEIKDEGEAPDVPTKTD
jgi:hypothetical protein